MSKQLVNQTFDLTKWTADSRWAVKPSLTTGGSSFQQYAKTTQSWYTTHTGEKTYFLAYGLAWGEKKKTVAALKANLVLDVHPPGK
ncbi:hypothetical protein DYB37_010465 [Aphanomyces astaci]|uniref:Uncharacterized protein n=1 Tax=Aphanomyces astaci TaxID=112090 RepID=A0A3R6ZTF5_APHAT|nr:hypothetical protein DYB35_010053 [Aphanomyces astaci]RHZ12078.1 hypothetical protein DYB37_010465 [Aphanomyces astaci]